MADPVISEMKFLGNGPEDFLEVRVPDDYPDPENLRLVIYDRTHDGSTTASPAASDIYDITAVGKLYTEDVDGIPGDDDGLLFYTIGTSENGTNIRLHAEDAVGLYNVVTGETYGLFSWGNSDYTVSTATGDPFAGQTATRLDNTGQVRDETSIALSPDGEYVLSTTPGAGENFICFTEGTGILTPNGEVPVEELVAGDTVVTKDSGAMTVRWIGQRRFVGLGPVHDSVQPVAIRANAFGPDVPERDTMLSGNHSVLADHWKTSLYFADDEVLVRAKALLNGDFAFTASLPTVTYFHVLLDQHSLVRANGMWCESLFLGSECMEMLTPYNRTVVFDLFPGVSSELASYGPRARQQVGLREAALIL
ncbi:MAG: Hint domain-containing protein [Pseudomonadota bacterium]